MGIGIRFGDSCSNGAGGNYIWRTYFGDKMSPLSDTTNLAAGITGTDLFEHIRHMIYTTLPGLVIALIVYWFLGRQFSETSTNQQQINDALVALETNFVISSWLLIVPAFVIFLVARKVPALPALVIGVFLGWLCHIFIQGGSVGDAVNTLQEGFSISSGNRMVDELFNRGGINDMMYTISLTIVAMTFAGVMEGTGMLKVIVNQILKLAKNARSLVATTIVSAFFTNIAAAEQYISVLLPGRMYAEAYEQKKLHSKNLSRALEDGGTITSPLVPWNTCGVFIMATLSIHPFQYAPYAILNISVPIIAVIFALFGVKLQYLNNDEMKELKKEK